MGKLLATATVAGAVAVVALLAGCHGMYASKAERLHRPPLVHPPKVAAEVIEPPAYIEDCTVNFSAPAPRKRDQQGAAQYVTSGASQLQQLPKERDGHKQVLLLQSAVDLLRTALAKDPYNAEATLELALAYDVALRKGCALAMLRRLADMTEHPVLAKDAQPRISQVVQNPHWFRSYRNAALHAVGH